MDRLDQTWRRILTAVQATAPATTRRIAPTTAQNRLLSMKPEPPTIPRPWAIQATPEQGEDDGDDPASAHQVPPNGMLAPWMK